MTTRNGQRVLVTAGAGGIGHAIAIASASAGAKVPVCDVDEPALSALRARLPGITTTVCDIAERASVRRMVAEAIDAMGGLDVPVNNAGTRRSRPTVGGLGGAVRSASG